jgi:hypothetical protein
MVEVVCKGGEAIRQKERLEGRTVGWDSLGIVHKTEDEEDILDIQKREGSGWAKSEVHIEVEAAVIERISIGSQDLPGRL